MFLFNDEVDRSRFVMNKLAKDATSDELVTYVDSISQLYKGQIDDLCMAVGVLVVGRIYGWRVMRIVLSPVTYRRCQRVLGLDFKDILQDETKYSRRCVGYDAVKKIGEFWEVVVGRRSLGLDTRQKREVKEVDS